MFETILSYPYNLFAAVALWITLLYFRQRRWVPSRNLPLPPGPRRYPIIGNFLDVPSQSERPWLVYRDWGTIYGSDIVYYELFGQPFLILNSLESAIELLDRRATNYSDRLQSVMLLELMGWDFNFGLLHYGPSWRKSRRMFHENFNSTALQKYQHIQLDEARALALRLFEDPTAKNLFRNIRRTFAGTIMRITYGIPVRGEDDEYVARAEAALVGFSQAAIPGAFWVDFFPILKYVPSWLPGASFKRKAAHLKVVNSEVCSIPFNVVKKQSKEGIAKPSAVLNMLDKLSPEGIPNREEEEKTAQGVAAVAYEAGADTTVSVVQAFFVALATHPEVLTKAQEELDRVVGRERLPNFGDRSTLPFIQAICKEVIRWHQVLPLCFPHLTREDDEYNGYLIPKGTVVLANSWAILHDPDRFEDPLDFKPERYMEGSEFNKRTLDPGAGGTFGFGRRYPVPIEWEIKPRDEMAIRILKEAIAMDA